MTDLSLRVVFTVTRVGCAGMADLYLRGRRLRKVIGVVPKRRKWAFRVALLALWAMPHVYLLSVLAQGCSDPRVKAAMLPAMIVNAPSSLAFLAVWARPDGVQLGCVPVVVTSIGMAFFGAMQWFVLVPWLRAKG